MRRDVNNSCYGYENYSFAATLVTPERFSAAVAFLMQRPEDNLPSNLGEHDERLLTKYRRVFGGRIDRREANRLLGCLGWVPF